LKNKGTNGEDKNFWTQLALEIMVESADHNFRFRFKCLRVFDGADKNFWTDHIRYLMTIETRDQNFWPWKKKTSAFGDWV
jgi:hypothetical protein